MSRFGKFWCSMAHGGGHIERDSQGRINWRCVSCGRWGDNPVSVETEDRVMRAEFGNLNGVSRGRAA